MGGATTFEVLWSSHGVYTSINPSKLKRSIGNYIDYGVPPSSLIFPTRYVQHTQLLPAGHVWAQIAFPSSFSHSGFGYKQLSVAELTNVFGYSSRQVNIHLTSDSFPVVPIQILNTLL